MKIWEEMKSSSVMIHINFYFEFLGYKQPYASKTVDKHDYLDAFVAHNFRFLVLYRFGSKTDAQEPEKWKKRRKNRQMRWKATRKAQMR